jgi:transposase InsO family protein
VHQDNYGVYGARRVWTQLNRQGVQVARCTVERLMRENGLRGLLRDKFPGAGLTDRDTRSQHPHHISGRPPSPTKSVVQPKQLRRAPDLQLQSTAAR